MQLPLQNFRKNVHKSLIHMEAASPKMRNRHFGVELGFPGYETEERSLTLRRSGIQIRCVDAGWQFSDVPKDDRQRQTFENIITRYPRFNAQHLYAIPQNNSKRPTKAQLASALAVS